MMQVNFEKNSFEKRMKSMLTVDFKRMFTSTFFYLMLGICFVVPILILVMTTMMEGTTPIDHNTGLPGEPIEAFDFVWQILGSVSSSSSDAASTGMSMDLVSMCNVNMMYFAVAVLVCVFVSDDFRSGYAKNLFTVRAKKTDYVISKTLVSFLGSAGMILAFILGAIVGGAVSSLPFTMEGFDSWNLLACILSKMLLTLIFVAIYLLMSVIAKQKLWLSILLSLGVGMLLFMMIPMLTPLDATFMHVVLCLIGGVLFAIGLGAISNQVLKKTSLV